MVNSTQKLKHNSVLDLPELGEAFQQDSGAKQLREAIWHRDPGLDLSQMQSFSLSPRGREDLLWEKLYLPNQGDSRVSALKTAGKQLLGEQILGLPSSTNGVFLSNGSDANAKALVAAEEAADSRGELNGRRRVVSSTLAHTSLRFATRHLEHEVLPVLTNNFQMDEGRLLTCLSEDVLFLQLTAGTTDLGTVEDLSDRILERCTELGIWVHVDACYGGFNIGLLPETPQFNNVRKLQHLLSSPHVNSVSIDTHKFVGSGTCAGLFFPSSSTQQVESYFGRISSLEPTSLGAGPLFRALDSINRLGIMGLRRLAVGQAGTAIDMGNCLMRRDVCPIIDPQTGMIAIQLHSNEEVNRVRDILKKNAGISCARIQIEEEDASLHGIRIVFPPSAYFHIEVLEALSSIISQSIEMARQERSSFDWKAVDELFPIHGWAPSQFIPPTYKPRSQKALKALYEDG